MTSNDASPLVIQNLGNSPVDMTILTGQTLLAGSVLGVVTESGKLQLVDSTAEDGSEDPKYILLEDVDASDADVTGKRPMAAGSVVADKLIFGGTDTISTHHIALKETGVIAVDAESSEAYDNE